MWSGAISFGLVNVPVKLYSAVSKKTVRFHQLNGETGNRIQQKRMDPETGEEVAYEKIVKGFELTKDRYVVITPDEMETLDPEKSRTIDIEDFVDLEEIDPIYYDHPYYLVPDKGAAKAYGLLLGAMERAGKVAIAKVVLRSKEQLVAIRPSNSILMMETMIFHDEVVSHEDIDDLPDAKDLKASDRELKMAEQLIESLSSDFDPEKYERRVPREGARADREEGPGRGDRRPARGAGAGQGPGPDGRARGEPRGGQERRLGRAVRVQVGLLHREEVVVEELVQVGLEVARQGQVLAAPRQAPAARRCSTCRI